MLGSFLKRNCPVEYELIKKAREDRITITADMIEQIAYQSDNFAFQSVEFRKALSDYRQYKCRTPNRAKFDLDTELANIKKRLRLN